MNVKFSRISSYKVTNLVNYLNETWGEKSVLEFTKKLEFVIENIKNNPEMCEKSQFDNQLHKGIITKHTSILYEVDVNTVFIVNIIDNRQNPEKITKELLTLFS